MTNEERDLITRFIERVAGAQSPGTQSPGTQYQGQPLPPIDPEADRLIADLFTRYPEARYRLTQMAFVQEHALVEAQNRISRLQADLQQARQAPPQQQGSPWGGAPAEPQSRGFLAGLFGGAPAARPTAPPPQYAPPPPQPQYPPGYNPGMLQQQGTGFFGSALRTAAGVAGGVVAADALMGLFSGHQGGFGGGFGGGAMEQGAAGFANPWGGQGGDPGDLGGAPKEPIQDDKFAGPAQIDQADWTQAPDQGGSGWQDAASDPRLNQDGGDAGGVDQGGWDQASDDGGGWGGDDTQNT